MFKSSKLKVSMLLIFVFFFFLGCGKTLSVTYLSDPPGAVLYEGQQNFGYTPKTLYYQVTQEAEKNGYKILRGTSVQWASGAAASIPSLRCDLRIGLNQQFTFMRPKGIPGLEADYRFALELEKIRIMQQQTRALQAQAQAQREQAEAQRQQAEALQKLFNEVSFQYRLPSYRSCTSRIVGNMIITDCF